MKQTSLVVVGLVAGLLFAAPARADTFTSTHGSADITTTTTGMTVILKNLFNPVNEISDILDGIIIAFSTATGGSTLAGLSNPSGFAMCTGSGPTLVCTQPLAADPNTDPPNAPLFGWTTSGAGTAVDLEAGAGSFKPYGIVNPSIVPEDGLGNDQHTPYLLGTVTFAINWNTALSVAPTVTGVTFEFGTQPATETGTPVPEPTTLALLGSGLVGLGVWGRKRWMGRLAAA